MSRITVIVCCFLLICFGGGALFLHQKDVAAEADVQEAQYAVERYYKALFARQWRDAAEAMHPEGLKTFRSLIIHIVETPSNPQERRQFLQLIGGVTTIEEFKQVDAKVLFARLLAYSWKQFSPTYRNIWMSSRIQIIGAVKEAMLYHVIVRGRGEIPDGQGSDLAAAIISVASAKKDGSIWKVLSSMELQKMTQTSLP